MRASTMRASTGVHPRCLPGAGRTVDPDPRGGSLARSGVAERPAHPQRGRVSIGRCVTDGVRRSCPRPYRHPRGRPRARCDHPVPPGHHARVAPCCRRSSGVIAGQHVAHGRSRGHHSSTHQRLTQQRDQTSESIAHNKGPWRVRRGPLLCHIDGATTARRCGTQGRLCAMFEHTFDVKIS